MTKELRKIFKVAFMFMIVFLVVKSNSIVAHAEDVLTAAEFNQFLTTSQSIDAKAEPDENAAAVFTYDAGATIYVTGETDDGWYIVFYQGQTGYINKSMFQEALETEEIDIEALNEEMAAQEVESKLIVEETERYRTESRRSRIWIVVIVLLVIGIFAVGIISTIQTEKKKKEESEDKIKDIDEIEDENKGDIIDKE